MSSLLLLGLTMILSASFAWSLANDVSPFLYFKKQVIWAILGIVAFITFSRLDYRRLRGWGYVGIAGVSLLLLAVLIPGLGTTAGGSSRWLALGPLSFQPSELAKLALVLFIADVFSRKDPKAIQDLSHTVLPVIPVVAVLAVLIMAQPDMGTTMLVGAIGFGMLFLSGAPLRYVAVLGGAGAAFAAFGALAEPYRRARVLSFLNPWADPLNTGYQTIQSLIAMGSGGFFGVGIGASRQKWLYVPNAHTDFIYAILGEELGLFGTSVVLGMFAFLTYLGIRIARQAPDRFGMYIAAGVTIWIAFQALVNMGAVTASLPITGVPMPLVSFGGSSLVVTLIGMGILTNIAKQSRPPAKK
ncbi:MAG: putative lipid II flippase FtsW [Actinobacteria bacterium]|nr:putative lipid II flippase FtsW [Actinomycetota bacterium]